MSEARPGKKFDSLIFEFFDLGRSDLMNPADTFRFACVFLCWIKLSSESRIPPESSFEYLQSKGVSVQEIARVFQTLSECEELGPARVVFSVDSWIFGQISSNTLASMMKFVSATGICSSKTDFRSLFLSLTNSLHRLGRQEATQYLAGDLSEFVVRLAGVDEGQSLYCPQEGTLSIAIEAARSRASREICCEMKRPNVLAFVANILCDLEIKVRFSDPLAFPSWVEAGELHQFDCAVVVPTWGMKYEYPTEHDRFMRFPEKPLTSEVLDIRHALSQAKHRVVALVPLSLLTRPTGGERDFRQSIVREGLLRTVIGLPSGFIPNTSIPCAVVVLDKLMRSNSVFFVELEADSAYITAGNRGTKSLASIDQLIELIEHCEESPISRRVTIRECEKRDFNLRPQQYVLSTEEEQLLSFLSRQTIEPLGSICTYVRGQVVDDPKESVIKRFKEVTISDINEAGLIDEPQKTVEASKSTIVYGEKQRLRPEDVILSVKGSVGQVGFVTDEVGPDWIASQMFVILRPKPNTISSSTLFRYLRSGIGQWNIQRATTGSGVNLLSTKALDSLPIIVPSVEEVLDIEHMHNQAIRLQRKISELRMELKRLEESHWSLKNV